MNVLIFENEKAEIENSFNMMNARYFNSELKFTYYPTYQELGDMSNLNSYKLIIIDIDLSTKSEKDGFGILSAIKEYDGEIFNKILILTGSSQVRNKLDNMGYENIPLLQKPIDFVETHNAVKDFLNK